MERTLKELKRPVKVAGLTGAIASGKTAVSDALRAAGYTIVDADEISRELFRCGSELERELGGLFPAAVKNGALDRKALRAIISTDHAERKRLNAFTHPKITEEVTVQVQSADKNSRVVLSAPLLFESGLSRLCDCVVCVYAPKPLRISRIIARDGVSEADAINIVEAQTPDTYRVMLSDFCIPSDRPMDEFTADAVKLFNRIFE